MMPTYDYKCRICGREESVFQSISEYCSNPKRPSCFCNMDGVEPMPGYDLLPIGYVMERKISIVPGSAISNVLAGDRHYDGLSAVDGTNIGSRSAHRRYMKEKDLTMASDFKNTWADAAKERQRLREGYDSTRKRDVREVVEKSIQN